jgi:hypothetical protein
MSHELHVTEPVKIKPAHGVLGRYIKGKVLGYIPRHICIIISRMATRVFHVSPYSEAKTSHPQLWCVSAIPKGKRKMVG